MASSDKPVIKNGRVLYSKDAEIEARLNAYFEKHKISHLEAVLNFPIYARRSVIKRFLALYELFQKTINLPGDIVDIGVFRGLSTLTFANFLEARNIGDRSKKVWGFDNFSGFTGISGEDGPDYEHAQKFQGGYDPSIYYSQLIDAIEIFDSDRFVGWKKRIELVEGNVEETIPEFVKNNPGLRISILHLDVDLYEPTLVALKHLYPLVVPGGVVIFDEYGIMEWGGESKAVEEYFEGTQVKLNKMDWINQPGAYILK